MPLPLLIPAAIAGGAALYGAIDGGIRQRKARKALEAMPDIGNIKYQASPELKSYYSQALDESRNPQGFSFAERANFNQALAGSRAANTLRATRMAGGNMSSVINGMNNLSENRALLGFAAQDAALKRQNRMAALGRLGTSAGIFQTLADRNTGNRYNYQLMTEQNLGRAQAEARQSRNNAIGQIGQTASYMLGQGMGSGQPFMPQRQNALPPLPTFVPGGFDPTETYQI